jgi:hypothetical protein
MPMGSVSRDGVFAMAQSDSRTQIVIACISLVGVLAAAMIANWGKISGSSMPSAPSPASAVQQPPEAAGRGGFPRRGAGQQRQLAQAVVGDGGDSADSVDVVSAVPARGSVLKQGQLTDFNITIHYRLTTSLPNPALQIQLHQYDRSLVCAGPNHIPEAEHVPMLQGDHTVRVALPYMVGMGKGNVAKGSIRFGATIWGDLASRQLFKTFELSDYCYAFQ